MKRVFIGLSPTAGYYYSLYEGLRERSDVKVTLLYTSYNKYGFDKRDKLSWVQRWFYFVHKKIYPINVSAYLVLKIVSLFILFPFVFFSHDVFVFASGNSFFREKELPLYRKFNKKVIAVFTGSDVRPRYINLFQSEVYGKSIGEIIKSTQAQKRKVELLEKNNAVIISHPTISHFQTKPYLLWLCIGFPRKLGLTTSSVEKQNGAEKIVAIHSPSNPLLKGTEHIKQIVGEINQEGSVRIELEVLGNVDSEELYNKLENADFLIDQMYIDTPLGGLATEAAVLGTPSVIGGYYAKDIRTHYTDKVIPPSLYIHPNEMKEAITQMAHNAEFRNHVASETHTFVSEKWSLEKVANNYMDIINDNIPTEWWGDPYDVHDIYPIGQKEHAIKMISQILRQRGIDALLLSDKPYLEKKIQEHVEELASR